MRCPYCWATTGRPSTVSLAQDQPLSAMCIPAVYVAPRWDEHGRRVDEQPRPGPRVMLCSAGHRFSEADGLPAEQAEAQRGGAAT